MDYQLGPKELQSALGKGALVQLYTQGHLPAHIESGPRGSLGIGNFIVGLQK